MTTALPLSEGQKAMWFLHRLAPGSAAYNVVLGVRVHSPLDPETLRRAVAALAGRHELLSSVYEEEDGQPVRRPAPGLPVERLYVAKLLYGLVALAEEGVFPRGTTVAAVVTGRPFP